MCFDCILKHLSGSLQAKPNGWSSKVRRWSNQVLIRKSKPAAIYCNREIMANMIFLNRIDSSTTEQTTPLGRGLLRWGKWVFFPHESDSCPGKALESKLRRSMDPGEEQHPLLLTVTLTQPSTSTAAAHSRLQCFSSEKAGQPMHTGTANIIFPELLKSPAPAVL